MNAAIVTLVAVLILCSHYISTLDEMKYRRKLIRQARYSMDEKKIRVLCQQKEALLNYSKGWIFLWDKELNILTCSGACQMTGEDKKALLAWLNTRNMNTAQVVTWLNMHNGQDNACTYLIRITPQVDIGKGVISAVGRITLLRKDEQSIS